MDIVTDLFKKTFIPSPCLELDTVASKIEQSSNQDENIYTKMKPPFIFIKFILFKKNFKQLYYNEIQAFQVNLYLKKFNKIE